MVAVQNYHGNPAPPGKPVLTFQTGDVIELLRGDPESQWWEVGPGPGRVSAPGYPLPTPQGRSRESCISRQGWVLGCETIGVERSGLLAGPGSWGVCLEVVGSAASPHGRGPPPGVQALSLSASCLACVLHTHIPQAPPRPCHAHPAAHLPRSRPAPPCSALGGTA